MQSWTKSKFKFICVKKENVLCFLLIFSFLFFSSPSLFSATVTWDGGSGNWNTAASWTPDQVPGATDDAEIDGGKTGTSSTVTLTSTGSIANLTIDLGDTLNFNNSFDLYMNGTSGEGTITNNGVINVNGTSSNTVIVLNDDLLMTGTGVTNLNNNDTRSEIKSIGAAHTLTIHSSHTLQGRGEIGVNSIGIDNDGLIDANNAAGILTLDPDSAATVVANTGTMQASAGVLKFNNGTWNNAGGLIRANGGTLDFAGSSGAMVIQGGTISVTGLGVAQVSTDQGLSLDGSTSAVTLDGSGLFNMLNGADMYLQGTIVNNLNIHNNATTAPGSILLADDTTLNGTGKIILKDSNSRIRGTSGKVLTIGSSQSVEVDSAGEIAELGFNQINFVNSGTVKTLKVGSALDIDPLATFVNTSGLIDADLGYISLNVGTFNGGTIQSGVTGEVRINGALVDGSTLDGNITVTNISSKVKDVTIDGTLAYDAGMDLLAEGNITIGATGVWNVGTGTADHTKITLTNDLTITGGNVNLANDFSRIDGGAGGPHTFTVGSGAEVNGAGNIGDNDSVAVVVASGGLIDADVTAEELTIDPSTTLTVDLGGTIQASNSSTLQINQVTGFANNGLIKATGGGKVLYSGTTNITGTGAITIDASSEVEFGAVSVGNTDGTAGNLTVNGILDLNGTTLYAEDVTVGSTGEMQIASGLVVDGDFTFALTDETKWGLDGPTAELKMTGTGIPISARPSLEIGGEDYGTDPFPGTVVGAAAGFVDNFDLTKLVIGTGAKVNLVDLVDNGNRIEHGFGTDEALYVGTLEFEDATGVLNVNGLHLYYTSLIGDIGQIEDVPVVFTDWTDGVNDAGTPFESGVVGTLPSFEMDWTGVGDISTSGDATILAVGSPAALPGEDWSYVMTAGGDELVYSITPTTAVTSGSFYFTVDTAGLTIPNGQDLASLYLYKDGSELFSASSVDGTNVTFLVTSTFSEFGIAANPEPTTLFLIGTGLLGLLPLRRKK